MKVLHNLLAAALLLAATTHSGLAAEAVFPPGVRVGLTPPAGLVLSKTFSGFESEDHHVRVLVTELPASAYDQVKSAFTAHLPASSRIKPQSIETSAGLAYYTTETAKNGATVVRRYSMIVPGGSFSGYVAVQIPQDATKAYPDDAIRRMFASAVIRKKVPVAEQLGMMPFKVTELGDFKTIRTLAPGALVLADGNEATGLEPAPFMIIGIIAATPTEPDDRGRFARDIASQIPGVRQARITMSEPIRINGTPAYETRMHATSGKDNTSVTIVQWLQFGNQSTLRIIGSAPRDQWSAAFPRFRVVRDGIRPRG
ncbi:MAG: hypothetical protein ACREDC_05885 [Bradyrhizobium sp.]